MFDEPAYRDRYPDLTNTVLAEFGIYNGYDHYLRHGIEEDRVGHALFDPKVYLAQFDPPDVVTRRAAGVFQHYLDRIESGKPELRTSIYFDPVWYLKRYPEVARDIAAMRWKCQNRRSRQTGMTGHDRPEYPERHQHLSAARVADDKLLNGRVDAALLKESLRLRKLQALVTAQNAKPRSRSRGGVV